MSEFPSQRSLQLPLLSVIDERGSSAKQAADALADHAGLATETRARRIYAGRAGHVAVESIVTDNLDCEVLVVQFLPYGRRE